MKTQVSVAILVPGLFALTYCAPPAKSMLTATNHDIARSMSVEERAKYCLTDLPQEDPETTKDLIEKLRGDWKRYGSDGTEYTFIFKTEPERNYASEESRSSGFFNWVDRQDIVYKKICVSKVLGLEAGDLADYRLVELMAAENEGGAAFAMKFETPVDGHKYPVLQMTKPYYQRYASNRFSTAAEVTYQKKIVIYKDKQ